MTEMIASHLFPGFVALCDELAGGFRMKQVRIVGRIIGADGLGIEQLECYI